MLEALRFTDPEFTAKVTDFTTWLDERFADDPRYTRQVSEKAGVDQRSFSPSIALGDKEGFDNRSLVLSSLRGEPGVKTDLCFDAHLKNGRPTLWVAGAETTVEEVDGAKVLSDKGEFMSVKAAYSLDPRASGVVYVETGNRIITASQDMTNPFLVDSERTGKDKTICPQRAGEVSFDAMKRIIAKHHKPITK